jgi:hypothetical protein
LRVNVCEEDPRIKQLIIENYVPWFCNVYSSQEYLPYDSAQYIPVICRIDPRNPEAFIDKTIGGTNPNNSATFAIFKETFYNRLLNGLGDLDSDGMSDEWEREYGLNPLANDAANDPDNDSLKNIEEYTAGTIPNDPDTDNDAMPDGWEVQYGLNPLVNDASGDKDNDRWSNLKEYQKGTIPNDAGSHPKRSMPWLPLLLEND